MFFSFTKNEIDFILNSILAKNSTYRKLNACGILRACNELSLRDKGLIEQKGKGRSTYYIKGATLNTTNTYGMDTKTYAKNGNTEPSLLTKELPSLLREQLEKLKHREDNLNKIKEVIYELCKYKNYSAKQLAQLLNRKEITLLRNFLTPMRKEGKLQYTIPDMPKHLEQAYKSV